MLTHRRNENIYYLSKETLLALYLSHKLVGGKYPSLELSNSFLKSFFGKERIHNKRLQSLISSIKKIGANTSAGLDSQGRKIVRISKHIEKQMGTLIIPIPPARDAILTALNIKALQELQPRPHS